MAKRLSLDAISSLSSAQSSSSNSGLEDINYLLYLETLQRFKEHETNLRLQAEEKARQYEEARAEYRYYFERYVQLYQLAATRTTLENHNQITQEQLDKLKLDLSVINRNIRNDESVGYLSPEIMKQCQQAIRTLKTYDEISSIEEETTKMKHAIEAIQSLNTSIELKLESVTTRSIDFYVEQLQSKCGENHNEELDE